MPVLLLIVAVLAHAGYVWHKERHWLFTAKARFQRGMRGTLTSRGVERNIDFSVHIDASHIAHLGHIDTSHTAVEHAVRGLGVVQLVDISDSKPIKVQSASAHAHAQCILAHTTHMHAHLLLAALKVDDPSGGIRQRRGAFVLGREFLR